MPHADAIQIAARSPVACAAVAWRSGAQLQVTVVVKATFALHPDAEMTLAPPVEVFHADVPQRHNPTLSVEFASEVAPYLARADVVLTGSAAAPEGTTVTALTVRFALFRDRMLFEKRIHVYGDRRGDAITPFDRMPLVYERAYGGLGHAENPFGTGNKEGSKPPNLIDPSDPARPACFAPLAATWPTRKKLLAKPQLDALRKPIAEIAGDFEWRYFQAAPPDQCVDFLAGNEWVVCDGLHPRHPRLQSRLPDARAEAHIFGLGPQPRALALVADTLHVDADALTCSVVWRGHFPVPGEEALATLRVEAGVETHGQPIDWGATHDAAPAPAPSGPQALAEVEGTMDLSTFDGEIIEEHVLPFAPGGPSSAPASAAPHPPAAHPAAPSRPSVSGTLDAAEMERLGSTLPFQRVDAPARAPLPRPAPPPPPSHPHAPPSPPRPWQGAADPSALEAATEKIVLAAGALPPLPAPAHGLGQTAELPDDAPQPAARSALPFVHGAAPVLPPPAAHEPDHPFTGTMVADDDEGIGYRTLPFAREHAPVVSYKVPPPPPPMVPAPAAVEPARVPIPAPPPVVEPPKPAEPPRAGEPPKVVEPPPPAAPPRVVEPPKPAEPARAVEPPKPAAPPPRAPRPPRPQPPPRQDISGGLYKRFDKKS